MTEPLLLLRFSLLAVFVAMFAPLAWRKQKVRERPLSLGRRIALALLLGGATFLVAQSLDATLQATLYKLTWPISSTGSAWRVAHRMLFLTLDAVTSLLLAVGLERLLARPSHAPRSVLLARGLVVLGVTGPLVVALAQIGHLRAHDSFLPDSASDLSLRSTIASGIRAPLTTSLLGCGVRTFDHGTYIRRECSDVAGEWRQQIVMLRDVHSESSQHELASLSLVRVCEVTDDHAFTDCRFTLGDAYRPGSLVDVAAIPSSQAVPYDVELYISFDRARRLWVVSELPLASPLKGWVFDEELRPITRDVVVGDLPAASDVPPFTWLRILVPAALASLLAWVVFRRARDRFAMLEASRRADVRHGRLYVEGETAAHVTDSVIPLVDGPVTWCGELRPAAPYRGVATAQVSDLLRGDRNDLLEAQAQRMQRAFVFLLAIVAFAPLAMAVAWGGHLALRGPLFHGDAAPAIKAT